MFCMKDVLRWSVSFVGLVLRDTKYLALVPPTIYYSKVGFELSKLVIRGQNISTPYVVPSTEKLSM